MNDQERPEPPPSGSKREKQQPAPKPLDPPPAIRIERDLPASEQGNSDAWLDLAARDLLLEPMEREIGYRFGPTDLSDTPGWQTASEPSRLRILESA